MREIRRTVCNRDCPDACSIVAHVEDGRVVQLGGDPAHPVTGGFLCWRTNNFLPLQYHPERLTTPLLRGNPVSWDEALDFAARELTRIRAGSGPQAIFHYRSGGSLGALKHLTDYFFSEFGPVTSKRGDICSGGGDAAQLLDFGEEDSHDLFDLLNSRNILLWGKNVVVSSPHTMPVLKDSAARKMLIDPVWHKTARFCDAFVQPRPGGDFALAMAVARVLFEEEWVDPAAGSYCDHLPDFHALAFSRELDAWCEEADVRADVARDIAARLHEGPTAIVVGWGMARRVNGGAIVRALDALSALSGNIGVAGGGVSYYFWRRKNFDFSFIRKQPPRTILEPLFGPELLASDVRAVWITAGNPIAMLPESATTEKALRSREFVCVVDSWPTDTTRAATLVLPTTTLLEDDDLLGAYGHHFVGSSRPVVAPPAAVKSDLEILQALAARVGLSDVMRGTAREWKERILRKDAGFTVSDLDERGPQRSNLSAKVLFADRKFKTASGKVNLITSAPDRSQVSAQFPLYLMALSTDKAQNSQWSKGQPQGPATVTVHPDSAGGIPDGGFARLESAIGSMPVQVVHDPRQRRDVALMAKGGHMREKRNANVLARARATDIGGGGALYDEAVRITP
ncbi:MAG: molybdopterin-containing oxidoreductase catalytic subunit [Deltaproteobacteria bacterium]|nr:MAG: molybdopterin-containing oxidoreductase catalytic subunit [Deltaproteobacteria bacterium]